MPATEDSASANALRRRRVFVVSSMAMFVAVVVLGSLRLDHAVLADDDQGALSGRLGDTVHVQESPDPINRSFDLRKSSVQRAWVLENNDGSLTTNLQVDGQVRQIRLEFHSNRSADFQVLVQTEPFGPLRPAPLPEVRTVRGTILGMPDAEVSGSYKDGRLNLVIRTPNGIFGVQPVVRGVVAPGQDHIVYAASDWVNSGGFRCGSDDLAPLTVQASQGDSAGRVSSPSTVLDITELAIDADVEYFQLNGSSVADTVHDIESIVEAMAAIYERDTQLTYEVTTIVVRTVEPDPYTSSDAGDLLCEFRDSWNNGAEIFINRDTAHLFTGKSIIGSTIGIAWVGVVCNAIGNSPSCGSTGNLAYGLSQSRFTTTMTSRIALTAHEVGHNYSAIHCDSLEDCHIMCSGLGGCDGVAGDNLVFGPRSQLDIGEFSSSLSCLTNLPNALAIPFIDNFATRPYDDRKWTYNVGGGVFSGAVGEPSPPYSMNLDAPNAQDYQDNEIRSNFIRLGGVASPLIRYATEHRGVALGGALIVEYWNNDVTWKLLNRLESDGVDQDVFDLHSHWLPADAAHDEFRIRYRVEVDGLLEDWYVDDVWIGRGCQTDAECPDALFCNGSEVCVDNICVAGVPPCSSELCEEDFRFCTDPTCSPPTLVGEGSRYLSITPPSTTEPVGFMVSPLCDALAREYVGTPAPLSNIAVLRPDPAQAALLTPAEWNGPVSVTSTIVVPATEYLARTICGTIETPRYSAAVGSTTQLFGDTTGEFVGGAWSSPNGVIDFDDIAGTVDAFRQLPGAPKLPWTDVVGCSPDMNIDFDDISAIVDGFRGLSFVASQGCGLPCIAATNAPG